MNITTMAIADVKPYWRNPRKNNGAVEKVALSIAEFGWRQPLVVNEDMVLLVGHTRLLAAKQLQMDTVPVHIARGLTEDQQNAYRLMDNRSHEDSDGSHLHPSLLSPSMSEVVFRGRKWQEIRSFYGDGECRDRKVQTF